MKQRPRLRKVLIGCVSFFLFVCVVLAGVAAWKWQNITAVGQLFTAILEEPEYAQGLDTPEGVLAYLQDQESHIALVSYTAATDGTPDTADPAIFHNASEPMPLASTQKIIILAAYATAVANGEVDPETAVTLAEWDRYYLPGTDGGAHLAALEDLGITMDKHGYALNPDETVTLDQMMWATIRFSDNAAPTLFWDYLGETAVHQVVTEVGLTGHSPFVPLTGMMLSWSNHETALTDELVDELLAMNPEAYTAHAWELHRAFIHDPWGEAEREWRREGATTDLAKERILVNRLGTMGTAEDYARIMAGVVTNTFISPEVSAVMRPFLEWPMSLPGNDEQFVTLGSKGGSLATVLTGATYVIPKDGDFANQPRVVVLFMREMPFSAWFSFITGFTHQQFELKLASDRTFATLVQETLNHE